MIKNKKVEKGYVSFNLEIKGQEWKNLMTRSETSISSSIKVPGFRPGKAPKNMILKQMDPVKVVNKAINMAIDSSKELREELKNIMMKENIISQPVPINDKIKVNDDGIVIPFKGIVYPDIKIGNYKTIKSKKGKAIVKQDEIDFQYSQFTKHLKEFEDITKGTIKDGDTVVMNFKGFVEDVPFPGGEADNYELLIGSKTFIPGFEDQMIGLKIGEKKDINVSFPKDYEMSQDLAGKPAKFEVEILRVKREKEISKEEQEKKLKTFGFDTLPKLKIEIKDMITKDKEDQVRDKFQADLIKEIIDMKETVIDIPSELVDSEVKARRKMFEHQLTQQGLTLSDYAKQTGKSEDEIVNQAVRPEAESRIKTTLIINQIAKQEKIEVSDKDIEKGLEEQAKMQRIPVEKLKSVIKMDILVTNLLFDKVINFLANLN